MIALAQLSPKAGNPVAYAVGVAGMGYVLWQMFVAGPRRSRKARREARESNHQEFSNR